jgi:hypothetical protein
MWEPASDRELKLAAYAGVGETLDANPCANQVHSQVISVLKSDTYIFI